MRKILDTTTTHSTAPADLTKTKGSQVPYFTIIVPSGTAIGCTVDARIGATPVRVTWLSEETLRIYCPT
jgi:hypothetical protein